MIKKYTSHADATISDCYDAWLSNRATGSNAGASDILEVFGIYERQAVSSSEESRVVINFPIDTIEADRSASLIPSSGSVSWVLEMFNAPHTNTLPRNLVLEVAPLGQSWIEGNGRTLPGEAVLGGSPVSYTYDDPAAGTNWINRFGSTAWTTPGGTRLETWSPYSFRFDTGVEDLSLDITDLVEAWIRNDVARNGLIVRLTGSQAPVSSSNPDATSTTNYYTKKFFGRDSEYFLKRPAISARWDDSKRDARGSFFASSSLVSNNDNLNTLYLYNYVKGQLRDIEGIGDSNIYVSILDDVTSSLDVAINPSSPVTGGWVAPGIYSASFAVATTGTSLSDKWHNAGDTIQYYRGEFQIAPQDAAGYNPNPQYITSLLDLRPEYSRKEIARFRAFIKEKNKQYNIYRVATAESPSITIESGSYEIFRVVDNFSVIPFGTGSYLETRLSFDISGNYFEVPMNLLQEDYQYGIRLAYFNGAQNSYVVQPEEWRFRVRS